MDARSRPASAAIAVLALALCSVPVAEEAREKKDSEAGKKPAAEAPQKPAPSEILQATKPKAPEEKVYTNEDLERMFGGAPEPERSPTASGAERAPGAPEGQATKPGTEATTEAKTEDSAETDPLAWLQKRQEREAERAKEIAAAEGRVSSLEERVRVLEVRSRQITNPYMARPQLSEKEQEEWAKLGSAERLERTATQLETARDELEQARAELARLRSQP